MNRQKQRGASPATSAAVSASATVSDTASLDSGEAAVLRPLPLLLVPLLLVLLLLVLLLWLVFVAVPETGAHKSLRAFLASPHGVLTGCSCSSELGPSLGALIFNSSSAHMRFPLLNNRETPKAAQVAQQLRHFAKGQGARRALSIIFGGLTQPELLWGVPIAPLEGGVTVRDI